MDPQEHNMNAEEPEQPKNIVSTQLDLNKTTMQGINQSKHVI